MPCSLNTAHTLFCRLTDCYALLLVVEDVLLELLVPALEFFKLILQGCLVLGDERLLVLPPGRRASANGLHPDCTAPR